MSRRSLIASGITLAAAQAGSAQNQEPLRIVVLQEFDPKELEILRRAAGSRKVEITYAKNRQELKSLLPNTEILYGDLQASELDFAPRLKWIQAGGAGMEGFDKKVLASPIPVTNMQRIFAPGIADTAMGLLLCISRGISTYYMPQFYKREWKPVGTVRSPDHIELAGRTMGIVGMGGIGTEIAKRAHYGFGMRIVATDAKPMAKPDSVEILREPSWFPEMAKQVDVLVSAAPHTPKTERMFNEAIFRSMKKGSIFLAMSRGKLYDDMALVKVLKEGHLRGAGLDVFPIEPVPANHPIFDCPNVVMTPHTSGWGEERQVRLVAHFAENIRRYTLGEPLLAVVDKAAGY
ncbi:D-2-hydroxyacid dehydrogenase [Bryobacter aggregatus]|uniref:D-2-hydroxyacid dehydrogenase n=1 Tax=Bryobacter aggregatus TaxID=360054 RepID=UPI0004E1230D|nr:D-2-hydroxyacid dehydrogenase [Bryobacter aggregatus]